MGTPGVDATATINLGPTSTGFNQIRFGIPSASGSSGGIDINAAFAAFDNISLKLVDIPVVGTPGDLNGDGAVTGLDFLDWQRGVTVPQFDADKLAEWQGAYNGGNLAGLAAVPEPTSVAMLVLGLSSLLVTKRR